MRPVAKIDCDAENPATRRLLAIEKILATCPPSARRTVERVFQGTASPRLAIKAHCLTCTGFDRTEIRDCAVLRCPLWLYRPYQSADCEKDHRPSIGGVSPTT